MVMLDWRKPVLGGQNKFHTPPQIELNYRQNLYNHRPSIEAGSAPASLQYKEEKNAHLWAASSQKKAKEGLGQINKISNFFHFMAYIN